MLGTSRFKTIISFKGALDGIAFLLRVECQQIGQVLLILNNQDPFMFSPGDFCRSDSVERLLVTGYAISCFILMVVKRLSPSNCFNCNRITTLS